ncbi:MAG: aminodeoxychorismate/anthranilate synthase component II [Candidatus Omnitrophota bacterium]
MIFVVDNYDSFTYNLVQYIGELGEKVVVFRNDKITLKEIEKLDPDKIIISPGPGRPSGAGISKEVILEFAGKVPILGVCLGHQSIAEVYGAKIIRSRNIMHGKVSRVYHGGKNIFKGIPSPFTATRYHSLVVDPKSLKDPLEVSAWTKEKEIMAIKHKDKPIWGVQFHPESVLTVHGMNILMNFIKI